MSLPEPALRRRRYLKNALKAASTVAVFALLLGHPIEVDGVRTSVWHALADKVATLSWAQVAPYLVAAALLKAVGVACAMLRWHLLLRGQGLAFNFGHIVGSFLIGRFLKPTDDLGDIGCRLRRSVGQVADLFGDHCEAAARVAGTRRLN